MPRAGYRRRISPSWPANCTVPQHVPEISQPHVCEQVVIGVRDRRFIVVDIRPTSRAPVAPRENGIWACQLQIVRATTLLRYCPSTPTTMPSMSLGPNTSGSLSRTCVPSVMLARNGRVERDRAMPESALAAVEP